MSNQVKTVEKFRLLMWKNLLLQWNNKCQLIFQILVPILVWLFILPMQEYLRIPIVPKRTYESWPVVDLQFLDVLGTRVERELLYSPKAELLEKIVAAAAFDLSFQNFRGVKNAAVLDETLQHGNYFVGIQFEDSLADMESYPKEISYALRFPTALRVDKGYSWRTRSLFDIYEISLPRTPSDPTGSHPNYLREGFLPLQHVIFKAYIKLSQGVDLPEFLMERYPHPEYSNDIFLVFMVPVLPVLLAVGFLYTCCCTAQHIAAEKEKQLKEIMKIIGVPSWMHWMAWFCKAFVLFAIPCVCIMLILKAKSSSGHGMFVHSNSAIILSLLLIYSTSAICFCFLIASFFSKANVAAIVTGVSWFIMIPAADIALAEYEEMTLGWKLIFCLMCNVAISYAVRIIVGFEANKKGLQMNNMWETVSPDDTLTMGHIVIMMLLSSVIAIVVSLYVEQIVPDEFGSAKEWYFPFTTAFWCKKRGEVKKADDNDKPIKRRTQEAFEREPIDKHIGLKAKNLKKRFGDRWVVKGISMNMYVDEVTVLLGHNGAGKTVTMSMLIGIIQPTSGTSIINGIDIRKHRQEARSCVGICPQYNVLFDYITVENHIEFFSRLRGLKGKAVKEEVQKYVKLLSLEKNKTTLIRNLSHGMRRRVSICCALCGGTKVVLLDEPSSGLDLAERRQLWSLLQREKIGRTILLTTHLMDEADILGDRVAIMCEGELKCFGTSFFLKKRYGSGYKLICVKRDYCDVEEVTKFFREYIPNIRPKSDIGAELKYELPDRYSNVFGKMFRELELKLNELGINGYGISITSLEEVFLKVGIEEDESKQQDNRKDSINSQVGFGESSYNPEFLSLRSDGGERVHGFALVVNQFLAMFFKKAIYTWRNLFVFIFQHTLPVFMIYLTVLIIRNDDEFELPPMTMSLQQYPTGIVVIEKTPRVLENSNEARFAEALKEIIESYGQSYSLINTGTSTVRDYILTMSYQKPEEINMQYLAAFTFDDGIVKFWLNPQPLHTAPMALNLVHNAVARTILGTDAKVKIMNYPVPVSDSERLKSRHVSPGFVFGMDITFAMAFVTSYYAVFLINERVSGAKLLQRIGGVKIWIFWLTQYTWNVIIFTFCIFLTVLCLAYVQDDGYKRCGDIFRFFFLLFFFGLAAVPLTYVFHYFFADPVTGFMSIAMISILMGYLSLVFINLLNTFGYKFAAEVVENICQLSPHYLLNIAIQYLYENSTSRIICHNKLAEGLELKEVCVGLPECCQLKSYFGFERPGIGKDLNRLFILAVIYRFTIFIVDYHIIQATINYVFPNLTNPSKPPTKNPTDAMDEDVLAERRLICAMSYPEIFSKVVVMDRVSKYYCRHLALNQISLRVKRMECFGLIGGNGAGKTTTFRLMTGDVRLSSGEAFVNGKNLLHNVDEIREEIGYCPQSDALFNDLTARETLRVYCLLRGEPQYRITPLSEGLAKAFGFVKYMDNPVKSYSAGNKRKLSAAISVIGNPSIIFLDEPTNGMDPAARHKLWKVVCFIRDSDKAFMLSSHSMEECEALCTRLAVMVNGRLRCIGSAQHLKNRFSKSLIWKIKVKGGTLIRKIDVLEGQKSELQKNVAYVKKSVAQQYPQAVLQEEYQSLLTYYVPLDNVVWSEIFDFMEQNREELNIEDYSISQAALEEIFLEFLKEQRSDSRRNRRKCCC